LRPCSELPWSSPPHRVRILPPTAPAVAPRTTVARARLGGMRRADKHTPVVGVEEDGRGGELDSGKTRGWSWCMYRRVPIRRIHGRSLCWVRRKSRSHLPCFSFVLPCSCLLEVHRAHLRITIAARHSYAYRAPSPERQAAGSSTGLPVPTPPTTMLLRADSPSTVTGSCGAIELRHYRALNRALSAQIHRIRSQRELLAPTPRRLNSEKPLPDFFAPVQGRTSQNNGREGGREGGKDTCRATTLVLQPRLTSVAPAEEEWRRGGCRCFRPATYQGEYPR
jgi:hypothetical protein